MKAINLKTEYLENPVSIDVKEPSLSWNCSGGKKQTAYEIIAVCDGKEIWNTGKVNSSSMTHIKYQGEKLSSRARVNWRVTLWDEKDEKGDSAEAFFEIGLLENEDWKAKWITGDYKPKKSKRYPVDCFLKTFNVENAVKKARLYATACGLYEAQINGEKAGDFVLAPGYTDYNKRIQYQTLDVTDQLKKGENELS